MDYIKQDFITSGIEKLKISMCSLAVAPICKTCDSLHCRRCVKDNIEKTGEYNIPGSLQCELSHIEREMTRELIINMKESGLLDLNYEDIEKLDYIDPFVMLQKKTFPIVNN